MEFEFKERGKIFIFEGPDNVGKTTLITQLEKILVKDNIKVKIFSSPGKEENSLGRLIYELHHNPEGYFKKNIPAISLQTLHVAAHLDNVINKITPAINEGYNILLDRFWLSTFIYGKIEGIDIEALKLLINFENLTWKNISPSKIFIIIAEKPFNQECDLKLWEKIKTSYIDYFNENSGDKLLLIQNKFSDKNALDLIYKQVLNLIRPPKKKTKSSAHSHLPIKTTEVFDSYWYFAAERQNIFYKRLENKPLPWTTDPILQKYKFTNAYRASDRTSQYLIKNVIYKGEQTPEEIFFRVMLFKIFNKIDTWELLSNSLGEISFKEFNFEHYSSILDCAINKAITIYSSAYIMPSGISSFGYNRKHKNHLRVIEYMMKKEFPKKFVDSSKMEDVFNLFLSVPTIGEFLAYQYTIDINYSIITNFNEMEFVYPGPGALDGIRKCFYDLGGLNEIEIIRYMSDIQEREFERLQIKFKFLGNRPLQLIDCQNLFCEVDKFSRVAHPTIQGISGRKKIKQKFVFNPKKIEFWYPPKWKINHFFEGE